jgi:hypothetical protein
LRLTAEVRVDGVQFAVRRNPEGVGPERHGSWTTSELRGNGSSVAEFRHAERERCGLSRYDGFGPFMILQADS